MLVIFKSEAHGDITMFGDVAQRLLKMMGQSGVIPGAIYAEDIPAVLERLQNVINQERDTASTDAFAAMEDNEQDEPKVDIAIRAFPLVEMLKAAANADCNVMWYEDRRV